MTTKAGLHTLRALQATAADIKARRVPAKPAQTRKVNAAHRGAVTDTAKAIGK